MGRFLVFELELSLGLSMTMTMIMMMLCGWILMEWNGMEWALEML